jgi:HK97 family phage major capsid protein
MTTLLESMINPQVMSTMIKARLDHQLTLRGFYTVENTLTGRPGDTLTIPAWNYIGKAVTVPENTEIIPTEMTTESQNFTVKKAAKGVVLTDEAILSGYGDPVGEATRQLTTAIFELMETEGVDQLGAGDFKEATGAALGYTTVLAGLGAFNNLHADETLTLLTPFKNYLETLKDERFLTNDQLGRAALAGGSVGSIAGARVVIVDYLPNDTAYLMRGKPILLIKKRDITVETQREMWFKRTGFTSDSHYVIGIAEPDKIVRLDIAA